MEKIEAPKKERKFLKAIGNIGKLLAQELVMGIGRKFIGGIVDKIKTPQEKARPDDTPPTFLRHGFCPIPSNRQQAKIRFPNYGRWLGVERFIKRYSKHSTNKQSECMGYFRYG